MINNKGLKSSAEDRREGCQSSHGEKNHKTSVTTLTCFFFLITKKSLHCCGSVLPFILMHATHSI